MLPHNANPLGKGAFATVYKGHHRTTKVPLAIKVIEFDSRPEQDKRYLTQELIVHPNIVEVKQIEKWTQSIKSFLNFVLVFFSSLEIQCLCNVFGWPKVNN